RDARGPAQGGAPLRGAHSRGPRAQGFGRLRRPGDRSLKALGGLRVLALVLLAALTLFIVSVPGANVVRNAVFDTYQRWFPLERVSAPVVIVLVDENAVKSYGTLTWSRARVAELFEKIAALQPAAIGVDMVFPEPD